MIDKTFLIENIFDDSTNDIIIKNLKKQRSWSIDTDFSYTHSNELSEEYSDKGMLLTSFSPELNQYMLSHNSNLNVYGDLILDKVLAMLESKISFEGRRTVRYLWNYYNKASVGVPHIDYEFENYCSIIYYLNTCDGYTMIGDKKINSVSGNAVLFDANKIHYGTGPKNDKFRYVLNIVFSYDNFSIVE
jgi:hypothetical protein